MSKDGISNLEPKKLWSIFQEICDIPHASGNEAKLIEYVMNFAKEHGLEAKKDAVGNVLLRKSATPGMENKKTIVLQGHLDMVPQKNNDTQHDFDNDPIEAYVDGDWVKANGTTLGADNGIGVAASLAVLCEEDLKHGELECLFTIEEETGMTGAFGLKPGFVNGDILLNLDSEDEGELYIGCAGGIDTNVVFDYDEEPLPDNYKGFRIIVKGLKGGHSGLDINHGRGNAIKILNRILWEGIKKHDLRLSAIDAGTLRNAIPRESQATVALPKENEQKFFDDLKKLEEKIQNELKSVDKGLTIAIEAENSVNKVIDKKTSHNVIKSVYGCPNGTIRMVADMEGVVETSTNLAILKSENGKIHASTLQRSSVDSSKEDLCNMVRAVFELAGADVEHTGEYPGWNPNVNSPILKTMKSIYSENFGKTPEVKVIHAGLECGLLGSVYPKLDMISFGPTIKNPHSPDEMVNIPSVKRFWEYLIETLKNAPEK